MNGLATAAIIVPLLVAMVYLLVELLHLRDTAQRKELQATCWQVKAGEWEGRYYLAQGTAHHWQARCEQMEKAWKKDAGETGSAGSRAA